MGCNNQGIMHLATKQGGFPVCRNRRAHMSTTRENFVLDGAQCKKCRATLDRWIAAEIKKEKAA